MFWYIWVDEVGRWAWAWPVVAWACLFDLKKIAWHKILKELKDSKKLSKTKRNLLTKQLEELEKDWICYLWIWIKSNKIIDKIGIKKANKLAMLDAIIQILEKIKDFNINHARSLQLKIDGNDKYIFEWINIKTEFIIKWDNLIDEIKAASIFAKVMRDNMMWDYAKKYVNYNLENNVWYGTKKHIEAINKSWITPIHRKSYAPIKNYLDSKTKTTIM